MNAVMLVALGGALGSVARFKVSGALANNSLGWLFVGTFTVNIVGCFLIGLIAALAEKYQWWNGDARLFLMAGMLGGFTTFSTFGLETFMMLKRQEFLLAAGYVSLSIIVGLILLYLGYSMVPGRNV